MPDPLESLLCEEQPKQSCPHHMPVVQAAALEGSRYDR